MKQLQLWVLKLVVVLFTFRSDTGENHWWICIQRKLKNKRWVKILQNGAIIIYTCFLNNKNHRKLIAVKWCLILDLCYISEVSFILFWIFSHSSMIWQKEDKDKPVERRPFDRDQDLNLPKMTGEQKKSVIQKSKELGSRFQHSRSGSSFLWEV